VDQAILETECVGFNEPGLEKVGAAARSKLAVGGMVVVHVVLAAATTAAVYLCGMPPTN
jgi:hypothetical protein